DALNTDEPRILLLCLRSSFNLERAQTGGTHQRRAASTGSTLHSGKWRGPLKKLFVELKGGVASIHVHGQHILWLEAQLDRVEPKETVDHQTGAGQQHKRQSDLANNQNRAHIQSTIEH